MTKEKILFNANHIFIAIYHRDAEHEDCIEWSSYNELHDIEGGKKDHWETQTFESPLGFYYKKCVLVKEGTSFQYKTVINQTKIFNGKTEIWIRYPIECNDVKIGFDARPWDICIGDKSLKPHMIKAIEMALNTVFEYAVVVKTWKRSKDRIFKDMFGDVNGYQTLSNEIKILSHGFDPRESFRNRKKK